MQKTDFDSINGDLLRGLGTQRTNDRDKTVLLRGTSDTTYPESPNEFFGESKADYWQPPS